MKDGIEQSRDIQGNLDLAEIAGERIASLVSWLRRAGGIFEICLVLLIFESTEWNFGFFRSRRACR